LNLESNSVLLEYETAGVFKDRTGVLPVLSRFKDFSRNTFKVQGFFKEKSLNLESRSLNLESGWQAWQTATLRD
jgi:hypothetical protein